MANSKVRTTTGKEKQGMKVFAKEELRIIRIKKGITIAQIAEAAGITKQAISQFEKRKNGISPDKTQAIIVLLGVSFDDVFELVER